MTTQLSIHTSNPLISIIVIIYNMSREAPRTLRSLSSGYQNISEKQYEVIVVENGSPDPLSKDQIEKLERNFKYFFLRDASPSPATAINHGVNQASGKIVGIIIDGARILSPGVLKYAMLAFNAYKNPVVTTLGWHIGPDIQCRSFQEGYNEEFEDNLLLNIGWPTNGYRLFEISTLAGSSRDGWFCPISESNCLFVRKTTFYQLDGFDERFDKPGGGLVNLDFYKRACELPGTQLVILLGEGTFHQVHGGVTTQVTLKENAKRYAEFAEQYIAIRGEPFDKPLKEADFLGRVPAEALNSILVSCNIALGKREDSDAIGNQFLNLFRRLFANIKRLFRIFKLRL